MIQRMVGPVLAASVITLACFTGAGADHLTGNYRMMPQDARTARMAGSIMRLQQSGRNIQAQITGSSFTAQLQGETDGGNNARGYMTTQGGERQYFEAAFDARGARLSLIKTDSQGRPDYSTALTLMFAREGGGPAMPGGSGGPPPGVQQQPGFGPLPGHSAPPDYPSQPPPGQWPPR
jgi:hypothetical protein